MRDKKIYLCSFCMYCPREKDKNTYYCVAGKAWRVYGKTRECPGFRPKPKKPDNANDKSAAGFYSSIGYLFASVQYFLESFDPEPMMEVIADNTGQKVPAAQFEQLKQMGAGGIVWFYDIKITGSLKTPQPKIDGDTYTWDGSVTMKAGGMGGRGGMGRELNQEQSQDVTFKGIYKDGKWMITDPNQDSAASGSPSSSSSSSSGSLFGI